jgi:hypothetical protein
LSGLGIVAVGSLTAAAASSIAGMVVASVGALCGHKSGVNQM